MYVQNAECPYTIVRSNYGYLKVECKTFYIDVEKLRDEEHSMYMNLSLLNKSVPSKYDFEISDEFLEILVKQAQDCIINYEELFSTYKRIKAEVHKLIQIKTMGLQSWNTSEDFKKEFYDDK